MALDQQARAPGPKCLETTTVFGRRPSKTWRQKPNQRGLAHGPKTGLVQTHFKVAQVSLNHPLFLVPETCGLGVRQGMRRKDGKIVFFFFGGGAANIFWLRARILFGGQKRGRFCNL